MSSPATIFPFDAADAAGRLADHFNDLSNQADTLAISQADTATPDQVANLKTQAQALEDLSHHFTADAIGETLRQIQGDLDNITSVTQQAKDQLGTLNDVSKAISILASAVSLGTAIASGNPGGILSAADSLAQTVTS
jgi:rhamnose utilization protein RhaD (predicted bifunctional aldolase and dehydrogenase)